MKVSPKTLMLGWGNQGRRDDGLGPELIRVLGRRSLPGLTLDSGYQLQVEDAYEVARYPRVIFVDADRAGPEPFSFRRLLPAAQSLGFSSHSVTPGGLLALTRELFGRLPEAWLLGIRGYELDCFDENLSAPARKNLDAAVDFVVAAFEAGHFDEMPAAASDPNRAPTSTASDASFGVRGQASPELEGAI